MIYTPGDTVLLRAFAEFAEGGIAKVGFWNGGTLLSDNPRPFYEAFEHTWENIPDGIHVLTARAYNGDGTMGQSAPVRLIAGNREPVFVTSPVLVVAPGPHAHDADFTRRRRPRR